MLLITFLRERHLRHFNIFPSKGSFTLCVAWIEKHVSVVIELVESDGNVHAMHARAYPCVIWMASMLLVVKNNSIYLYCINVSRIDVLDFKDEWGKRCWLNE